METNRELFEPILERFTVDATEPFTVSELDFLIWIHSDLWLVAGGGSPPSQAFGLADKHKDIPSERWEE
jgi:hypothetical protein